MHPADVETAATFAAVLFGDGATDHARREIAAATVKGDLRRARDWRQVLGAMRAPTGASRPVHAAA